MASVYEILYGHKPGTREPEDLKVFKRVADGMMDLEPLGYAVVREVATIGAKNDLGDYLPYMFFAFYAPGSTRNWPAMPLYLTEALRMGRWVVMESATVPNYTREIVTPPLELERNVDRSLRDLAEWCFTSFRNKMTFQYIKILKDNMAAFGRVSDNPDAGSKVIHIKSAFEERVDQNPAALSGGHRLSRMIRFMAI